MIGIIGYASNLDRVRWAVPTILYANNLSGVNGKLRNRLPVA